MKYKIAIKPLGHTGWIPSEVYAGEYTSEAAHAIVKAGVDVAGYRHRYLLYPSYSGSVSKPYRRHAAVTPLELRGAYAMLESAILYLRERAPFTYGTNNAVYRDACTVLVQAKRAVHLDLVQF